MTATREGSVYWIEETSPKVLRRTHALDPVVTEIPFENPIVDIASTANVVFVLDRQGVLSEVRGIDVTQLHRDVVFIDTSGPALIMGCVPSKKGVGYRRLYLCQENRKSARIPRPKIRSRQFVYEPSSGRLTCYTSKKKALGYDPDSKTWSEIEVRRASDSRRETR